MKMDKESSQNFGCCSATDDISVENSVSDEDIVEIDKCIPSIKVKKFITQQDDVNFPKRMSMDLQFQDIKYTVGKFSFRNRRYGECKNFNLHFVLELSCFVFYSPGEFRRHFSYLLLRM